MTVDNIVVFDQVSKTYQDEKILKELSFELSENA